MGNEDFVLVQLTSDGEKYAAGGVIRLAGSRHHFQFEAGKPQRVTRKYDWDVVLSREVGPDGEPLFELSPDQDSEILTKTADTVDAGQESSNGDV